MLVPDVRKGGTVGMPCPNHKYIPLQIHSLISTRLCSHPLRLRSVTQPVIRFDSHFFNRHSYRMPQWIEQSNGFLKQCMGVLQ